MIWTQVISSLILYLLHLESDISCCLTAVCMAQLVNVSHWFFSSILFIRNKTWIITNTSNVFPLQPRSPICSFHQKHKKPPIIIFVKDDKHWYSTGLILPMVSPGLHSAAMVLAQALPKTTRSSRELAPSLLAPCTEAQAASPQAYRPGTTRSWPFTYSITCQHHTPTQ